jgi:hypothetical protein
MSPPPPQRPLAKLRQRRRELGAGAANCLERAVKTARPGDAIVMLTDQNDPWVTRWCRRAGRRAGFFISRFSEVVEPLELGPQDLDLLAAQLPDSCRARAAGAAHPAGAPTTEVVDFLVIRQVEGDLEEIAATLDSASASGAFFPPDGASGEELLRQEREFFRHVSRTSSPTRAASRTKRATDAQKSMWRWLDSELRNPPNRRATDVIIPAFGRSRSTAVPL